MLTKTVTTNSPPLPSFWLDPSLFNPNFGNSVNFPSWNFFCSYSEEPGRIRIKLFYFWSTWIPGNLINHHSDNWPNTGQRQKMASLKEAFPFQVTLDTNYWDNKKVCDILFPILKVNIYFLWRKMVNYTRGSNQNYYPRMELGLLMLAVRLDFWATLVFIVEIRY